jgi:hypothetical protein
MDNTDDPNIRRHAARRCNPVLPPALSRRIANELGKEFAQQAELEHAAALPITVMLAPDDVGKAKLELGFIGACVTRVGGAELAGGRVHARGA